MIRKLALLALFPLALVVVAAMRLAARFGYLVRFGELFSSRLGHLAGNLECYLCERDAGVQPRALDIWIPQRAAPANAVMHRLALRAVRTAPADLVRLVSLTNCMFDGWQRHIIEVQQLDRDIGNLWEKYPPHFALSPAEESNGHALMHLWGLPPDAKWVCLIARDAAYLPHLGYHAYRDTDIESYAKAALALAERGYYVFRMGAAVAKPFKVEHPRIIDYAANGMRSDLMDVYLGARCAFCITSGTGFDAIPAVFRRPLCFVNYAPFEYLPTWFPGSLAIWKHHEREGKRMSVAEIVKSEAGHFMQAQDFEVAGIRLVDNTPEELRDVALEMAAYARGGYSPPAQDAFWAAYPRSLSKYNQRPLHGEIRMRIGREFLRQYAP